MLTDFPVQAIIEHLVQRVVDVLPMTGAGVTLIGPALMPRYVAASNSSALQFEEWQTELGDGPCLAVFRSGEPIFVPDLLNEERFGEFGSEGDRWRAGGGLHLPVATGSGLPRSPRPVSGFTGSAQYSAIPMRPRHWPM